MTYSNKAFTLWHTLKHHTTGKFSQNRKNYAKTKRRGAANFHPSQEASDVIHHIEELFGTKTGSSLMELLNAVGVLEKEALALSSQSPSCCGVKEKIIGRFIRLSLQIEATKIQNDRKKQLLKYGHLGSKSQTKKVKENSGLGSTSSNPRTAGSVSG